jgi:hypothetical protein
MMAGDAAKAAHPTRVFFGESWSFLRGNAVSLAGREYEAYFGIQMRPSGLCQT